MDLCTNEICKPRDLGVDFLQTSMKSSDQDVTVERLSLQFIFLICSKEFARDCFFRAEKKNVNLKCCAFYVLSVYSLAFASFVAVFFSSLFGLRFKRTIELCKKSTNSEL